MGVAILVEETQAEGAFCISSSSVSLSSPTVNLLLWGCLRFTPPLKMKLVYEVAKKKTSKSGRKKIFFGRAHKRHVLSLSLHRTRRKEHR